MKIISKTVKQTLLAATTLVLLTFPSVHAQEVEATWDHHIEAWQARDVDAIVADYTEDAIFIINNQVFEGKEAIRSVFLQLFQLFDEGSNRIDTPTLRGRFVFITWHFTPTNAEEFFGTDTFVIENGKIVAQTIASPLYDTYKIVNP